MASSAPEKKSPLVSVVIPCYRQARYLGEAIESVLAQTYRAYEILVIDDASPDDVGVVAARYPVACARLPQRQGVARARNFGLERARGEFVVFLDADDRLLPDALAAGTAALAARPRCGFVWGLRRLIDGKGKPLPPVPEPTDGTATYLRLLRRQIVGPPAGVMFRRELCLESGGFEPDLQGAEDYELYLRLAAQSHEGFGHGQLVVEYRVHGENMSVNHHFMLGAVMRVLAKQEPVTGKDRMLRRALAAGRRTARDQYGCDARLQRLSQEVRGRHWAHALWSAFGLLTHHPRVFGSILVRRLTRAARVRA